MRDNPCYRLYIFHTKRYVSQPSILCQDLSCWIHFYKTPRVEDWRTFQFELNMELSGQLMTGWLEWSTEWGTFTKDVTVIINSIFSSWHKDILRKFNQVNNLSQIFFASLRIIFILTTFWNYGNLTMCYRQWSFSLIKYRRWCVIDL